MGMEEIKGGLIPGAPTPGDLSPTSTDQPSYDHGQNVIEKGLSPGWPTPDADQSNRR